MKKDLPYSQKQTGLFNDTIDKDKTNWGMLVKRACMYTNHCLSFFIMMIHLLVQLCKQEHTETPIWKQCDFPHMPELPLQASLLWTRYHIISFSYFQTLLQVGSFFTWRHFLISHNKKHISDWSNYDDLWCLCFIVRTRHGHALWFLYTLYEKLRHSFTKKHRQFWSITSSKKKKSGSKADK